jgi:hypothetical protein
MSIMKYYFYSLDIFSVERRLVEAETRRRTSRRLWQLVDYIQTGRLYTNWLNGLCIVDEVSQWQLVDYIQTGRLYAAILAVYI